MDCPHKAEELMLLANPPEEAHALFVRNKTCTRQKWIAHIRHKHCCCVAVALERLMPFPAEQAHTEP
eukprot:1162103-Pelagomonas_calceolata.AAC.7